MNKSVGTTFQEWEIKNLGEIEKFDEDFIFNCMGYEGKKVFKDEFWKPWKGHLIHF